MGIFSRKSHRPEPPQPLATAAAVDIAAVITVMPEKFLSIDAPRFWTARKLWTAAILFLVALVGGVYWLLTSERFAPQPLQTKTTKSTTAAPTAPAANTVVNAPASPANTNTDIGPLGVPLNNSSTPSDINAPAGSAPVVLAPPAATPPSEGPLVLPPTKDTDVDGLTDAEEQLWHTDPSKPDTDNDGYTDLEELLHGYNPTGPGRLATSGLVKTYTTQGYVVLYPASWTASPSSDGSEVQFIASPDEFVSISKQPNPSKLSIADWYASVVPGTSTAAVTTQTIGTLTGVLSPDQRTFYYIAPDRPGDVVVVSYNVGTKTEVNFSSTLRVIVANLTPTSAP